MSKVVLPPLPEPVYHQWRRKNMPWSLEFAFNSMCHATTDDSEVRTLHTADQLRARDLEVARLVLEGAAGLVDGNADHCSGQTAAILGANADAIREMEVRHHE